MGIGEYQYQDRDKGSVGCNIIGMATLSKKPPLMTKNRSQGRMSSPNKKIAPTCPLMATIVATSRT